MDMVRPLPLAEQFKDVWKVLFYIFLLGALVLLAMFLPIGEAASHGLIIGGIFGVFGHFQATRISLLELPGKRSLRDIENVFSDLGYEGTETSGEYIPRIHRLLRFNAQILKVESSESLTRIIGPQYLLRRVANHFRTRG